ncbi:MAG: histidine kinase [Cyclobacteriaceae bacterium]|nr:histidine kinase [Cyclobacteriaceae bacterium HetDA_MAG_MS6]
MKDIKVLYVDDEEGNLNYFRSAFRREFEVLTANSGAEGLEILDKNRDLPLILTDQRMPQMSGVTFLMQSINLVPNAMRILVTGYSDMETVINAINHGHIYYFINKPWSYDEMRIVIQRALDTYQLRVKNRELLLQNEIQEKERIAAQLMNLQNQVNPHFLFNCLNVLYAMVPDNYDARNFIKQMSANYRYILDHTGNKLVVLKDELEFVKSYLYLQRVRFKDAIFFEYDIGKPHMGYHLPSATLQLLIENAIKHNVATKEKPLAIKIFAENDWLVVRNKFQPLPWKVESTGIGHANLRKRFSFFTEDQPEFYQEEDFYLAKIPLLNIK